MSPLFFWRVLPSTYSTGLQKLLLLGHPNVCVAVCMRLYLLFVGCYIFTFTGVTWKGGRVRNVPGTRSGVWCSERSVYLGNLARHPRFENLAYGFDDSRLSKPSSSLRLRLGAMAHADLWARMECCAFLARGVRS